MASLPTVIVDLEQQYGVACCILLNNQIKLHDNKDQRTHIKSKDNDRGQKSC